MQIKIFLFILVACYLVTLFRLLIDNNFIISIIGSFFFGFVIGRRFDKSINKILLTGFCSCFTSFSGFIYYLYQLIKDGNYVKIFMYLNIIFILNLFMMYLGWILSRKIT